MQDRQLYSRSYQFRTVDLFVVTVVVALTVIAAKEDPIYGTTYSSILLVVLAGILGAVTSKLMSHAFRYGLIGGLMFGVLGFHLAVMILSLGVRSADKPLVVVFVCCGGFIGGLLPTMLKRWRQVAVQFRKCILFVGLASLVIVTAFATARFQTVRKQTRIVAKLQSEGARIEYRDVNPFPMMVDSSRMSRRSDWLRTLLGMRVITRVLLTKNVDNITTAVDFGSIDTLASMPLAHVKELELHADQMDDEVVALLNSGQLLELTALRIRGRRFNDASLSRLHALTGVSLLDLWGTSITDESIDHIATFPLLAILDVRDTDITETGLNRLKTKGLEVHYRAK